MPSPGDLIKNQVIDPWGHPYLRVTANSGVRSATWLFSQGPDGQSETLGNDPDDIAPWKKRNGLAG
jgi:Type II secretion system (T2SS), protein G